MTAKFSPDWAEKVNLRRRYGIDGRDPAHDAGALALARDQNPDKLLYLPKGEVDLTATTEYGTQPIKIVGDDPDSTRVYHGNPTGPLLAVDGTFDYWGLPETEPREVLEATALGSTTLKMNTAGVKRNDLLHVQDASQTLINNINGNPASIAGELIRVREVIDATTIGVSSRLLYAYSTSATVRQYNPVLGCFVQGISFHNPANQPWRGELTMTSSGARPLSIYGIADSVFRNIHFYGFERSMIRIAGSYNVLFDGIYSFDGRDDMGGAPYTIVVGGETQGITIVNGFSRGGRHYFTTAAKPDQTPPQLILLSNCQAFEHTNAPFDTHPGSRWITFSDCLAAGSYDGEFGDSPGQGFKLRGLDERIVRSQAVGCDVGVRAVGTTNAMIEDSNFDDCRVGVVLSANVGTVLRRLIIREPLDAGVQSNFDNDVAQIGSPGLDAKDIDVTGNPSSAAYDFGIVFDPTWDKVDWASLKAQDADVVFRLPDTVAA